MYKKIYLMPLYTWILNMPEIGRPHVYRKNNYSGWTVTRLFFWS